tara:strand:- start:386 stop:931 length:546 start_codon:yes stop_codon:yes gene_type:complete
VSKQLVRKKFLADRKKNYKSVFINYFYLKQILKKFNFLKKKNIGAYYPINYEIDCFEILKKFTIDKYKISLPVTKKKNEMDFFEWSFNDPLNIGKMGIPEPYMYNKVYPDILIVPLVAFDKNRHRLGYGGGYYDRYIEKIKKIKKILTIGIAFSFQETDNLKINSNDKQLDYILTENSNKK